MDEAKQKIESMKSVLMRTGFHLILVLTGMAWAKILNLEPLMTEATTTRMLAVNFVISMLAFYSILIGSIVLIYISVTRISKKTALTQISLIRDCSWIYAVMSGIWFIICFIPMILNAHSLDKMNEMVFSIGAFILISTFITHLIISILKRKLISKQENEEAKAAYIEKGRALQMQSESLLLKHEKLSVLSSTENDRKKFQEEVLSFKNAFNSFHIDHNCYMLRNKKWPAMTSFGFANGDIKVMIKEVEGGAPTEVEKQITNLLSSFRKYCELPFESIQRSMKYKDKLISKTFIDDCIEAHCQVLNTIRFLLQGVENDELRLSVDYVTRKTDYMKYVLEFQRLLKTGNFVQAVSQIVYTDITLSTVTIENKGE